MYYVESTNEYRIIQTIIVLFIQDQINNELIHHMWIFTPLMY